MPTAYCVPGLRSRVVLSQGTIDALSAAEVGAVLAHERAHLRERHDLILEFFSVMYTALPPILRSPEALREVRLLAEVLADRSAVKAVGTVVMARTPDPHSAAAEFFINVKDNGFLNGGYSVFGNVIAGMDVADSIFTASNGVELPANPVKMTSVTIATP